MTPKLEAKKNQIRWNIGLSTYPMDAVYGACYVFLDRCYVYLDKNGKDKLTVSLKGKTELGEEDLKALSGEFHNELLNQALRKKISQSNKRVREYIVSRALFSAEPAEPVEPELDLR